VRDHLGDGLDPEVSFNYLGQFDQVITVDGRWGWSEASGGANRHPQDKQTHLISVNARIMNRVLQVGWRYSEAVHRRETIENLAQNYLATLVKIIRHCQSPEAGGYTPSDFPLARVSQSDLDKALIGTKSGDGKAVFSDLYPLTPLQQGLWFHALVNPESGVYVKQHVFRIEGHTNRDVLRQAWEKVMAQHAILRTGIIWEGLEHPLQLVRSTVELPWAEVDWRESPDNEHQSRLLKFLDEDRLRGFDLTQAPLMRLTLIQVAETSAILVWSFHHLILDRWSVDLVQQEVWSAYQTLVQGQPLQINALRPYREYIGWLQDQDLNRAEQYWCRLLSGFTAPTVLGVDQAPPTRVGHQESSYDSEKVTLSEAATSALSRWARQQQLTVNTVVQGAWALLLSRYSGSEDVVFGTTVAGRSAGLPGIDSMVGLFINTLPARVKVSPGHCVVPWLTALQEQQVTLREYEYTPLYEIQKWSEVPAGEPLFNTLLVFENIPQESGGNLMAGTTGLNVQRVAGSRGGETNYPLTVVVVPGRTLQVRFTYDTEHYTAEAITRMVGHFQRVLTGMIRGREQTHLGAIPLLTEAEHQLILVDWNDTSSKYPRDRCVHQLFEQQVEQTPDAVAVVYGDEQLSYRELNARANQLAHYLKSLGVGPEVLVGLCVDRSLEMVVGILGVLKAGGAYIPLDPTYPKERLQYMVKDSGADMIMTSRRLMDFVKSLGELSVISLDDDDLFFEGYDDDHKVPTNVARPGNLAYVIYTSGSTGLPKGTLIEHKSLVNYLCWFNTQLMVDGGVRLPLITKLTFDASLKQLFAPLLRGDEVLIFPDDVVAQPARLLQALAAHHQFGLNCIPSLWKAIIDVLINNAAMLPMDNLSHLFIGGERLSPDLVKRSFETLPHLRIWNLYGPSETTANACAARIVSQGDVTIGRPIANTQIYILDPYLQVRPMGVPGELHIGGEALARGYLSRPELTAERFIPNPFSDKPGARLYKTGDLVRYLSDGNIEFLGRLDNQVKIRGFRIELGEVEATLCLHPYVSEAVVVAREDRPGDKRLVAYVVATAVMIAPSTGVLRAFLQEKLPDYMIPSAFVPMDAIPLTAIGKVDRRALPAPDVVRPDLQEAFVAPRSPSEELVAGIWSKVLGVERIGVYDSFFELGGHSLLVVQIVSRIREVFEVELPLRSLFETPTIAGLTELIETILLIKQRPQTYRETTTSDRKEGEI
jgi:amino acid adenylation domain-containing protein/non-ribosomal peptide synthase protein (TIGR01720 family)